MHAQLIMDRIEQEAVNLKLMLQEMPKTANQANFSKKRSSGDGLDLQVYRHALFPELSGFLTVLLNTEGIQGPQ